FGLLCVGIAGVWGWRGRSVDGVSAPIPDLDLLPVKNRVVSIEFDSDVAQNAKVFKARHMLGKELYKRGASTVLAVTLPSRNGEKQGLDDFLKWNGLDAFSELDVAELPPTDFPPFTSGVTAIFADKDDEKMQWIVKGVQPKGANSFRVAPPKVGKSWWMLDEAYCVSTATPLFGKFEVPQKRRVMVIEEEDNARRVRARLRRIISAHGGGMPEDEYFRFSIKNGFRLDDSKWMEALSWELKIYKPDIVYMDVFSRLHALNINSQEEMASIVLQLDALCREHGCCFAINHHDRKNGDKTDQYNEIMGSRVLAGFSDATIFLARTPERNVLKVTVSLKDEPEDGSFEPEFLLRLADTDDLKGTRYEYLGVAPDRQASAELRDKVLAFVMASEEWVTRKQVADGVRCSKPTAAENLDILADIRALERRKSGQAWEYRKPQKAEK